MHNWIVIRAQTPGHLELRKSGLYWRRNSGGRDENISTSGKL